MPRSPPLCCGQAMHPRPPDTTPSPGVGLAVMACLADVSHPTAAVGGGCRAEHRPVRADQNLPVVVSGCGECGWRRYRAPRPGTASTIDRQAHALVACRWQDSVVSCRQGAPGGLRSNLELTPRRVPLIPSPTMDDAADQGQHRTKYCTDHIKWMPRGPGCRSWGVRA